MNKSILFFFFKSYWPKTKSIHFFVCKCSKKTNKSLRFECKSMDDLSFWASLHSLTRNVLSLYNFLFLLPFHKSGKNTICKILRFLSWFLWSWETVEIAKIVGESRKMGSRWTWTCIIHTMTQHIRSMCANRYTTVPKIHDLYLIQPLNSIIFSIKTNITALC